MTALLTLRSAVKNPKFGIAALILLTPVIFPKVTFAASHQTLGQPAQIFEIKSEVLNQTPKSNLQPNNESSTLTMQDVEENDPLVSKLKDYLDAHESPLSPYAGEIIKQPQWQRALAISYVESHMGRYCANNNCSGIGGAPGMKTWRKYSDKLEWFKDMCQLLETPRYKEKYTTFQKMRGVYVQPGSDNWVNGATKKFNDLMEITQQAELDRQEIHKNVMALVTFPESLQ